MEGLKLKIRNKKLIGYWMSEKKSQKLNWSEFAKVCRSAGYELVKLDLNRSLEDQGPFSVIIHKLNDIIRRAQQNDAKSISMIENVEKYLNSHPEVVIIDPLDHVRTLLDRYKTYKTIHESDLHDIDVFTPSFVELTSSNVGTNLKALNSAGVKFPFVCKPLVASGSDCHQMAIVFNVKGLKDCKPPCVAHTIVNHNAVLYKLYIVGQEYKVVKRRSLKNFYPSPDRETIYFHSHDVSKTDSVSSLSDLDEIEEGEISSSDETGRPVNPDILTSIVKRMVDILGMSLLGIDVVVENSTGRHAVIDINPYPGYEGYPGFFNSLLRCIESEVKKKSLRVSSTPSILSPNSEQDDSGFETADSSDEKKKNSQRVSGLFADSH